jgi:hypothetical protein
MARIFISHSSRDDEAAARMKGWLASQEFETTFLDFDKTTGIPPGADWEKTLYREVEQSQAVIINPDAELARLKMVLRRVHAGARARQGDLLGDRDADRRRSDIA